MAIKKEKTVLVQTRIPASLGKVLEARAAEEMCSVASLVRRAILFTEEQRAHKTRVNEFLARVENKKRGRR